MCVCVCVCVGGGGGGGGGGDTKCEAQDQIIIRNDSDSGRDSIHLNSRPGKWPTML